MEVRGQLCGVGYLFLLLCGFQRSNGWTGFHSKGHHSWVPLLAPAFWFCKHDYTDFLCFPDFGSCHFRFTTGRLRARLKETDATLKRRSSPSRAARLTACCQGYNHTVTMLSTSEWSTGKGKAQPAQTKASIHQREVRMCPWDHGACGTS